MQPDQADGVVFKLDGNVFRFTIDTRIYPLVTIFKACYVFIDRCFLHLAGESNTITVTVKKKDNSDMQGEFAGELLNELINQRLRLYINQETGKIREILVAHAFSEGRIFDDTGPSSDYHVDPASIGTLKGPKSTK